MVMVRRIQKTFDWEYLIRVVTGVAVMYVLGTAVLSGGPRPGGLDSTAAAQTGNR